MYNLLISFFLFAFFALFVACLGLSTIKNIFRCCCCSSFRFVEHFSIGSYGSLNEFYNVNMSMWLRVYGSGTEYAVCVYFMVRPRGFFSIHSVDNFRTLLLFVFSFVRSFRCLNFIYNVLRIYWYFMIIMAFWSIRLMCNKNSFRTLFSPVFFIIVKRFCCFFFLCSNNLSLCVYAQHSMCVDEIILILKSVLNNI